MQEPFLWYVSVSAQMPAFFLRRVAGGINQTVFFSDAFQLFQHGFRCNPEEKRCGGCMDAIHREPGKIIREQDFPCEIRGPHDCGRKIHQAAI